VRRLGRGHRIVVAVTAVVAILVEATGAAWSAVLGAVGGAGLGLLLARWALGAPARAISRPLDCEYTLDLLRRAHGGRAAWAIGLRVGDAEARAHDDAAVDDAAMEQGVGLVRLASVDGRAHVAPQPDGTLVAVGDFPYGAGVLLSRSDAPAGVVDDVTTDLRRLVAAMRIVELEVADEDGQLVARRLALQASGAQTLGGVARAGAELAQDLSQRAAAIVVQDADGRELRVAGISSAADRRLLHAVLSPAAAVWRAVEVGLPVVTQGNEDVFGPGVPERRRKERAGTAYPLADGHTAVGALVVLGPPAPDGPVAARIARLIGELGPRIAAARSVHEAERRAVSDPLTGLANRREFERVLGRFGDAAGTGAGAVASLVYVDLDHFKRLNDTLGHAAGDAALRHVKALLEAQIREGDLVARIGGEEFAVWLPQTPLGGAVEVAERIRRSIGTTVWHWNGGPVSLSASCGVAAYPDSTGDWRNLPAVADAALYRAKEAGRDRVEVAVGVDAGARSA
jgi:diguanylate cyclase (GGDEF)-like protein